MLSNLFKILIVSTVIGVIAVGYYWQEKPGLFNTAKDNHIVALGDVYENIKVAGKAKSASEVALRFEVPGKIEKILVKDGTTVDAGTVIATLESKKQTEALAKARASYEIAVYGLEELKKGAREEDIAVTKAELAKAESGVKQRLQDLLNTTQSAYATSDDAIRNKTNQFFHEPESRNSRIIFIFNDYDLKKEIEKERSSVIAVLDRWKKQVDSLDVQNYSEESFEEALYVLNTLKNYLNLLSIAVNNFDISETYTQDIVSGYRSNLSTARDNVNNSIESLTESMSSYTDAVNLRNVIEKQLLLKSSGTQADVLSAQEERVSLGRSLIREAEDDLEKTKLVSPIGGVISDLRIKVGEVASEDMIIAKVVASEKFELEADVPEVHVGKVELGNKAEIVFDAFPSEVYRGIVERIDAAPTEIDGVVNYKTIISFARGESALRTGMTATVKIMVSEKSGALVIPSYLIYKEKEGLYTYVISNGQTKKQRLEIGIKGDNGLTEVISGLTIGDKIAQQE